jgi:tripartite-type tricarboxylate transporter receptor subunit TctC
MSSGSAGAGSIRHLTMVIFAEQTGIELLHVSYRGGSAMVNGLLTGEIDVGWSGIPNVLELIAGCKLRGYCISVLRRSPSSPAMPTCDELGQRCFDVASVMGMHGSPDTSPKVIASLQREIAATFARAGGDRPNAATRHGDGGEWHRELRSVHQSVHGALCASGEEAGACRNEVK